MVGTDKACKEAGGRAESASRVDDTGEEDNEDNGDGDVVNANVDVDDSTSSPSKRDFLPTISRDVVSKSEQEAFSSM